MRPNVLTKILTIAGTIMVWFAILFPLIRAFISFLPDKIFHFDYLILELSPIGLVGAGMLFWASLHTRLRKKLIGWSFCLSIASLVIGQIFAIIAGLIIRETKLTGWVWSLFIAFNDISWLSLIPIGTGGFLLLLDLLYHQSADINRN